MALEVNDSEQENNGKVYHSLEIVVINHEGRENRLFIRPADIPALLAGVNAKAPIVMKKYDELQVVLAERRKEWETRKAQQAATPATTAYKPKGPAPLVAVNPPLPRVGKTERDRMNKGPKNPTNIGSGSVKK